MTETSDQSRLSEIARSLNLYQWQPTAEETTSGAAFFQLAKSAEEKERGFPRGTEPGPWTLRLHTENVAALVDEVTMLREEFLPKWRERLPVGSPMAELFDMYVRGAQPVVAHADAVLAAWAEAVLPEPTEDEIAYRTRYAGVPAEDVTARLRFEVAASWEEESPRRLLWEQMAPAWNYLGAVRASVMAATSVDVEY